MANKQIKVGVVGASGYTGSDLVRLAVRHPNISITTLTANTHAGKTMGEVFPHLGGLDLPSLVTNDDVNWEELDTVFCGLPHATSQELISGLPTHLKIIDMSADFRLRDTQTYAQWYGNTHAAPELQKEAVYGLSEHYRDQIAAARLVACPGCYPTAALMLLLPLVKAGAVDADDLIIDAKSGVSGAGR
ncbi:MAG: N-acetyl-gamma-glutamyl-phosphate reductase, partial [Rhizobiales bacterium]|nr:N-acetyl-gamma-glutamyl-phosphate reductase [Hyphomicrobiales bacterium]